MATFDASQITDLAEILGTNSEDLGAHLTAYASGISDSDKVRVLELVIEWQAVGTSDMVVTIEPKERNFGARIGAGATTASLASRIANFLQWTMTGQGARLARA